VSKVERTKNGRAHALREYLLEKQKSTFISQHTGGVLLRKTHGAHFIWKVNQSLAMEKDIPAPSNSKIKFEESKAL